MSTELTTRPQEYKIISANSLTDLETKVSYFLGQAINHGFKIHGDIQMYSYTEFVQVLTRG